MSEHTQINLKAALEIALAGFEIIPCRQSKAPYIVDWPNQGTTDQNVIRKWFGHFSEAVPGILTGTNNLLVIDCDIKDGANGIQEWNYICAKAGFDQSQCFKVETPSGGLHIYFRQTVEPLLGNTVKSLANGIDTRGQGGQVIAPGSVLSDGRTYRVVSGSLASITSVPEGLRLRLAQLGSQNDNGMPKYASAIVRDEVAKVSVAPINTRNDTLNTAAFNIGTALHLGIDEKVARAALEKAALSCGLDSVEILRTIESGLKAGAARPRMSADKSRSLHGEAAIVQRVSDFETRAIRWIWRDRMAVGKLTMIAGDPGLGKSQLSMFIAAQITTGGKWPNGEGFAPKGSVVVLSCEDDVADTIRPRLEALGADLDRVIVIPGIRSADGSIRGVSLQKDLDKLEAVFDKVGDVRMVIIDPITAYLGPADGHSTGDVRGLLAPLQELATRRNVAVLAISHLNKSGGGGKSINAVTGSLAFVAATRATFLVAKDKDNEQLRVLVEVKNNIGRASALAFTVESVSLSSGIGTSKIKFEAGTIAITADEALSDGRSEPRFSARNEATEFLKSQLCAGSVGSREILEKAKSAAISEKTLRRSADQLGVISHKDGFSGGWLWSWPAAGMQPGPPKMPQGAPPSEHGTVGNLVGGWPSSDCEASGGG